MSQLVCYDDDEVEDDNDITLQISKSIREIESFLRRVNNGMPA